MIIMRIPQQVSERVKEAPTQALRAVFSGIGQVLLVADRIKSRAADPARAHPAETKRPGQNAPAAPKDETRWRSLDETGNVRLLSEDDAPERAEPAAAGTVAAPEQAALPVPNYDDLTVASLRARLRNLDSAQVRILLDYEKANAGRADVLTMYERRIAKLENGQG
jgi:hypothetical protein